jgi:cytosine/adenosine deaminase-related metal-dependent hydrolase
MVDMHCDETDDPLSRHIETLAARPSGSACRAACRLASDLDAFDGQLLCLQAAAADRRGRVAAIPNPLINITLQGRHDTYPKRRGMTRVPEMLAAGHQGRPSDRIACSIPGIRWEPPTCSMSPSWAARGADDKPCGNAPLF